MILRKFRSCRRQRIPVRVTDGGPEIPAILPIAGPPLPSHGRRAAGTLSFAKTMFDSLGSFESVARARIGGTPSAPSAALVSGVESQLGDGGWPESRIAEASRGGDGPPMGRQGCFGNPSDHAGSAALEWRKRPV